MFMLFALDDDLYNVIAMLIAKSMVNFLIFWLILNLLKVFLPIRQIHVTTESESNDLKTQKYKIRIARKLIWTKPERKFSLISSGFHFEGQTFDSRWQITDFDDFCVWRRNNKVFF